MPTATINGAPLHYLDRGEGLPVLLLHGFPLCAESFAPQFDRLCRSCRVIVPDHRGFGASPPLPGKQPLEMSRIAQDALALLDHLKIDQAVVGGVSMGGYATMALLREDAGRVKGLMLIDTQPNADDEAGKAGREETARAIEQRGTTVLVEKMMPKLLSPTAAASVRTAVERMIRENPPDGAAAASRGMALRADSKDVLARYAGPALVVVGEQDAITPPEKAKAMAGLISGARLEVIPGAGHLSNLEAAEQFNAVAERFLAEISRGMLGA